MRFRVSWRNVILDALAQLYVEAAPEERDRMASGVEALNRRLADDPLAEGESREGEIRITFSPLLAVRYRVDEQDRVVRIVGVRRYGR